MVTTRRRRTFSHDEWSRITTLPASLAGGHALTTSYYVNDLVRTQSQNGVTHAYGLDPLRRTLTRATTRAGTTNTDTYRYVDGSDEPAWISQGTYWTRNVPGLNGDLAATESSTGSKMLQLSNLHGDVVAECTLSATATAPSSTFESDEFGVPRQQSDRRYGYLGSKQRSTELQSGAVQMGVRSYIPSIGRFTAVDPVLGGSANSYDYANADPVNQLDLDGRQARIKGAWCGGSVDRTRSSGRRVRGSASIDCVATSIAGSATRRTVTICIQRQSHSDTSFHNVSGSCRSKTRFITLPPTANPKTSTGCVPWKPSRRGGPATSPARYRTSVTVTLRRGAQKSTDRAYGASTFCH